LMTRTPNLRAGLMTQSIISAAKAFSNDTFDDDLTVLAVSVS
jgi:hypothetical protein